MHLSDQTQGLLFRIFKRRVDVSHKTDHEYVQYLLERIAPLTFVFFDLQRQKKENLIAINGMENELLQELEKGYKTLKGRLKQQGLLEHPAIKKRVCIIDSILKFRKTKDNARNEGTEKKPKYVCNSCNVPMERHNIYVLPSYAMGIFEEMKNLSVTIFEIHGPNVLQGFVETQDVVENVEVEEYTRKYVCTSCHDGKICGYIYHNNSSLFGLFDTLVSWQCPRCNGDKDCFLPSRHNTEEQKKTVIERFLFGKQYGVLKEAHDDFARTQAGALYNLELLVVAVKSEESRLKYRRKNIRYRNREDCAQELVLSRSYAIKDAVSTIKKKKQSKNAFTYNRKFFEQCVVSLIEAIPSEAESDTKIYPILLGIELKEYILYWNIQWSNEVTEVVYTHTFHDSDRNICRYVESLFDNDGGCSIPLEGRGKVNIRKNLEKVGLKGALYEQFIVNDGGTRAMFKNTQLSLTNLPQRTIEEIIKLLAECKTERFIIKGQDFWMQPV